MSIADTSALGHELYGEHKLITSLGVMPNDFVLHVVRQQPYDLADG